MERLARICLVLAFGHFISVPVLYFLRSSLLHYTATIFASGIFLTLVAFLCRYKKLEEALKEIEKKNQEMEAWVQRLGSASSQISAGDFSTTLPTPPNKIFEELTHNMEQMQVKLNRYFSNLLLKDRLSSLGILASGIAHELNTPLTTIQFALHSDTALPKETKELLQGEVERMGKITHDLLFFAKPHPEESFDLNEVIRRTEPLLKKSGTKPIPLVLDLCWGSIPLRGEANHIQQILINLVHNSMDATEECKSPMIRVTTEKRDDGVVILTVADNGSGIDQENLQKILDPFFTTKSPGRGTGLGLFVVHQIVQKHDGIMHIESKKGAGTTIRILFLTDTSLKRRAA
jgi:signal transduction histidine kinase